MARNKKASLDVLCNELHKNIACPLCQKSQELLSLSCGHLFCLCCIEQFKSTPKGPARQYECPLCKNTTCTTEICSDEFFNDLAAKTTGLRQLIEQATGQFQQVSVPGKKKGIQVELRDQDHNNNDDLPDNKRNNDHLSIKPSAEQKNQAIQTESVATQPIGVQCIFAEKPKSLRSVETQTEPITERHNCCIKTNLNKILQLNICDSLNAILKGLIQSDANHSVCDETPRCDNQAPSGDTFSTIDNEQAMQIGIDLIVPEQPVMETEFIQQEEPKESTISNDLSINEQMNINNEPGNKSDLSTKRNSRVIKKAISQLKKPALLVSDLHDKPVNSTEQSTTNVQLAKELKEESAIVQENKSIKETTPVSKNAKTSKNRKMENSKATEENSENNFIEDNLSTRAKRSKVTESVKATRKREISKVIDSDNSEVKEKSTSDAISKTKATTSKLSKKKKVEPETIINEPKQPFKEPQLVDKSTKGVTKRKIASKSIESDSNDDKSDTSTSSSLRSSRARSSSTEKQTYKIMTSGLDDNQRRKFDKLSKTLHFETTSIWSPKVTHLVVNMAKGTTKKELLTTRSLKYLMALIGCKWIVSFDWITACNSSNRFVDEHNYEIRGARAGTNCTQLVSPRKSRLGAVPIFGNHVVYFNKSTSGFSCDIKDLSTLVSAGHGVVADSIEDLLAQAEANPHMTFLVVNPKDDYSSTQCSVAKHVPLNKFIDSVGALKNTFDD